MRFLLLLSTVLAVAACDDDSAMSSTDADVPADAADPRAGLTPCGTETCGPDELCKRQYGGADAGPDSGPDFSESCVPEPSRCELHDCFSADCCTLAPCSADVCAADACTGGVYEVHGRVVSCTGA